MWGHEKDTKKRIFLCKEIKRKDGKLLNERKRVEGSKKKAKNKDCLKPRDKEAIRQQRKTKWG